MKEHERYIINEEEIALLEQMEGLSDVKKSPDDCGFWLYAPNADGTSPISERIESWLSRSGEKSQLKRRIQELENENAILRSLITH